MALAVISRTREYQRNWFQVDFKKLKIYFTIFVCFDRWISGKKAKLLEDFGSELANVNQLGQMNIQVLTGLLEVFETELTCLFTGLYLQDSSGSHLFPYARTHVHQSDMCDYTSNCLYFVQLLCLRVSQA
ncbi:Hypothetical_protein [Hexamita inflata]|uniref:Hypothetical_protein n=1 Tax=Hexamita inflata TaxID=28002 RepID=A0AA86PGG1_9EUKA|nr:Hypothetical protein HINF_LOCUS26136 [Hexamita inflata]